MSSRIDAYSRVSPALVRNDAAAAGVSPTRRSGPESAAGATPGAKDRVSVSEEARRLAETTGARSDERVASLRAAIENGTYEVDADAIASRIAHGD